MSLSTIPKVKQPKAQINGRPHDLIWRFSVEQYHAMIAAGILDEDDQVELLEGWLIRKMTINPKHRATVLLIMRQFMRMMPPGWYVDAQAPLLYPPVNLNPMSWSLAGIQSIIWIAIPVLAM